MCARGAEQQRQRVTTPATIRLVPSAFRQVSS